MNKNPWIEYNNQSPLDINPKVDLKLKDGGIVFDITINDDVCWKNELRDDRVKITHYRISL